MNEKEIFDLVNKIENLKTKIKMKNKDISNIKEEFEDLGIEGDKPVKMAIEKSLIDRSSDNNVEKDTSN